MRFNVHCCEANAWRLRSKRQKKKKTPNAKALFFTSLMQCIKRECQGQKRKKRLKKNINYKLKNQLYKFNPYHPSFFVEQSINVEYVQKPLPSLSWKIIVVYIHTFMYLFQHSNISRSSRRYRVDPPIHPSLQFFQEQKSKQDFLSVRKMET